MDGSPSSVISMGWGSWGSTGLTLTLGFGQGDGGLQPGTIGWLEYSCPPNRLQYSSGQNVTSFSGSPNRLHWRAGAEDYEWPPS